MEILQVDARTLALVSGLGGFIMAATMLGLYAGGTRQKGVVEWAIGGLLLGAGYLLGYLLLSLGLPLPSWLATSLANNLIGAGLILMLLGVQRYLGKTPWWWLLLVPPVMLASVTVPAIRAFPTPFVAETVMMAGATGYAAFLLWRAREPGITTYRRATGSVLLLFSAFLAGRCVYILYTRAISGSFDQHTLQILAFLAGMLFAFILTMALVLMIFREKELRMRDIARRDALTGLLNRYALSQVSAREHGIARRYKTPLTLLTMDLDHFKSINDKFGHSGGDAVLMGVANLLLNELREVDRVFRTGGEEFLILLPFTRAEGARLVAERLRTQIEGADLSMEGQSIRVSASFGVAELQPELESWEQALQRVDKALYEAKASGRNRVEMAADPAPGTTRVGR